MVANTSHTKHVVRLASLALFLSHTPIVWHCAELHSAVWQIDICVQQTSWAAPLTTIWNFTVVLFIGRLSRISLETRSHVLLNESWGAVVFRVLQGRLTGAGVWYSAMSQDEQGGHCHLGFFFFFVNEVKSASSFLFFKCWFAKNIRNYWMNKEFLEHLGKKR